MKAKVTNNLAMSFLTHAMDSPQLLLKIEASKSQDWPGGLAYVLVAKLMRKYKPDDTLAVAEQTKKLMSLKLKKNEDPETLGDAIAVLETGYGCTILESQKVAAIVNAAGGQYADSIQQTKNKFEAKGEVATADDLIEGMCEKFRISGSGCHSDDNDSVNETALTAAAGTRQFRGKCYKCGEDGHRALNCPKNKGSSVQGKCYECGKSGHRVA